MSLTALIFLTIYGTGLILTFYRPYYGVLTYIFEWHNHPPYFWWGADLPDIRWSYTIALATLISWFIHRKQLPPLEVRNFKPIGWIMVLVINMYMVSASVSVLPEESIEKSVEILKVLVNFALMITLIRSFQDYRGMIWLMILCVCHFGFIALGGGNRNIGVIAPNATEENALSAHVMAVLPFLGVYFLRGNWWQKVLIAMGTALCLNLIILANSRATFLGLLAIGVASIFLFKGKVRFAAIVGIVAASAAFMYLTNESFWERQDSSTYSDGSATSRLHIWRGGWEMLKDYPFGVGGGGFVDLSMDYIPEIEEPKSQHNTYIAVLTDWGYLGILLYVGFLSHIFILTVKVKRLAKKVPRLRIYAVEITAIQLALIGLCAAGMFHSRQYAEVVYWLSAFAVMLYNLQNSQLIQLYQKHERAQERPVIAALPAPKVRQQA